MSPSPVHRVLSCLVVIALAVISDTQAAEADAFTGRWVAPQPDRGVVVTLTIGTANTVVLPGTGPNGRVETLTLKLRNLKTAGRTATFTADLPSDQGNVDFEFRLDDTGDRGALRALRVDGEPADDDMPVWTLSKAAEAASSALFSAQLVARVAEFAARPENRRPPIVTLGAPEMRGEMVRVVVPVGELTTRLAGRISDARRRRLERKAREMVERDLRKVLAQQTSK